MKAIVWTGELEVSHDDVEVRDVRAPTRCGCASTRPACATATCP